ncbi:MAG: hypothetical protein ACJ8F3_05965 [Xanthobacteraceae bacterium]
MMPTKGKVRGARRGPYGGGAWVMFERVGEPAIEAIGVWAPGSWTAISAAFALVICGLAVLRGHLDPRKAALPAAVAVLLALAAWAWLEQLAGQDRAAERRALESRSFELTSRALMPGSPLACLDAIAGDAVEQACERALFASPDTSAAAIAYVAAQLALLAQDHEHADRGTSSAIAPLRRALEADRYGLVAHVLAGRYGCTAERCSAYLLLEDSTKIRTNLTERAFEERIRIHIARWSSSPTRASAAAEPVLTPGKAEGPSSGGKIASDPNYLPSSSSIPPVSIMSVEPHAPTAEAAASTARKPANAASSRPAAAPGAPVQLAPPSR